MAETNDRGIFEFFDRAMELEGAKRDAFLQELEVCSVIKAQKVRTLIQRFDQNRAFFEEPLVRKFVRCLNRASWPG